MGGGGHDLDHGHGHEHGHGHGHAVVGETRWTKVPDWRKYKVEDVPELVILQRTLAQKGLKDPWARNLVHMYADTNPWDYGKNYSRNRKYYGALGRGFTYGLAATVVTVACEYVYAKIFPSKEEHGHGHGHGHH